MNQVVNAINSLSAILQCEFTQIKMLHTQVPKFRGSKGKVNEFEHLLLNHLRPHQHRITEKNKFLYFQSLSGDEAIDAAWQRRASQTCPDLVLFVREFIVCVGASPLFCNFFNFSKQFSTPKQCLLIAWVSTMLAVFFGVGIEGVGWLLFGPNSIILSPKSEC